MEMRESSAPEFLRMSLCIGIIAAFLIAAPSMPSNAQTGSSHEEIPFNDGETKTIDLGYVEAGQFLIVQYLANTCLANSTFALKGPGNITVSGNPWSTEALIEQTGNWTLEAKYEKAVEGLNQTVIYFNYACFLPGIDIDPLIDGSYLDTPEIRIKGVYGIADLGLDCRVHPTIYVDDIQCTPLSISWVEGEFVTSLYLEEEGEHEVTVRIGYWVGGLIHHFSDSTTVIYDHTPPEIWVIAPYYGSISQGTTVKAEWDFDDGSPISTTEVKMDNQGWIETNGTDHVFTDLEPGVHILRLRITDAAGNVASEIVPFGVEEPGADRDTATDQSIAIAALAIVVAVLATAVAMLMRKKKP